MKRILILSAVIGILLAGCAQAVPPGNASPPPTATSPPTSAPETAALAPTQDSTPLPSPITEPPPTSTATSDPTAPPILPPAGDSAWATYRHPEYGFSFRYPEERWAVIERPDDPNLLALAYHEQGIALRIRFRRLGEESEMQLYGGAAGDFIERGTIHFLGEDVGRSVVVYEGIERAVHYNMTSPITRGDLQFALALVSNRDYSQGAIVPEDVQAETDRILESFEVEGD